MIGTAIVALFRTLFDLSASFLIIISLILERFKIIIVSNISIKISSSILRINYKLPVGLESSELYSIKLNIDMTKSKSSGLSIIIPSIFLIHLVNGTEFLNAT